jgi:hypothetical protein
VPPVRRPPRSRPQSSRCRYVARDGTRCSKIATIEGELCRQHAILIARELEGGVGRTIDSVVSGQISLGDVIAGAAQSYIERLFGQSPILRDLDQAARTAAHQAQARRARLEGRPSPPPPPPPSRGAPPRSSQSSPPPPPPPGQRRDPTIRARDILGFEQSEAITKERIEDRRRQLAKVFHPDRQGGSTRRMQQVNQAADLLLARLEPRP